VEAHPLALAKQVWDTGRDVWSAVYHYWQQERLIVGHQVGPVDRKFPLQPEVALAAGVGV
jgi:hypothetical protein